MQKQLYIFLLTLVVSQAVFTQVYKPFSFEIGTGLAVPSSKSAGGLVYMEPGYTFANRFKTGIRWEAAFLPMKTMGSTALTFDYYFVHNQSLRLFAGGGYSYYNDFPTGGCDPGPGTIGVSSSTNHSEALIRTGIEYNFFRFGLEYNFVPSTHVTTMSPDGESNSTAIYHNSYFAINIAIVLRRKFKNSGIQ